MLGSSTGLLAVSHELEKFAGKQVGGSKGEERRAKERSLLKVKDLKDLCIETLAEHFEEFPSIACLDESQVRQLSSMLSVDIDINVASSNVFDENYWKRKAVAEEWKNMELHMHGMTWKQLYFECKIQEILESYSGTEEKKSDDEEINMDTVSAYLAAGQDYVFHLKLEQLMSHLDLAIIFESLPNLSRFYLTYGVKHLGMLYKRSYFGMRMSDATSLAAALRTSNTLTSLSLPCNLIDDDTLRMILTGLVSNNTITYLDLSHNKITNHGARLIAKLLGSKSIITTLNLCDNQIHAEGGRYLGRALKNNCSLINLNLRLNRLTDEGGRLLLTGLVHNETLANLNLSSNSLRSASVQCLADILRDKSSLVSLDISSNELSEDDGILLVNALGQNKTLISIDTRKNYLQDSAASLLELVKQVQLI